MTLPFHCSCGQQLIAQPSQAGQRGQCPACGRQFTVPPLAMVPLPEPAPPPVIVAPLAPPVLVSPLPPPTASPAKAPNACSPALAAAFASRHQALTEAQVVPDAARCVQCGICSYNCPMGIDVRAHAWRGKAIFDSHCLTCSECVNRCPRGVLRFERLPLFAAQG